MADQWDSVLYDDRHSFVWKKVSDLIELLEPKAGERILDLGCGTGHLTAKLAESGADIVAIDGSPSMIAQARQNYPKLKFTLADAREFHIDQPVDAVFSNAVLHWIPDAGRVIDRVAQALKPGGRFVVEMGGKGNIARVVTALDAVFAERGLAARNPWYFPSAASYAALLEERGFEIRFLTTFERWNRLEHPERGLREWIEMFAGAWLEQVPERERNSFFSSLESRLRPQLWCDGAWFADYRRLRVVAVKSTA